MALHPLIAPAHLRTLLSTPRSRSRAVVPVCASWFLPNDGRTGHDTFVRARIPGARFFDLDAVKDARSPYPHMLPSRADFRAAVAKMGIARADHVVVYDSAETGIFSAPRVAWMFRLFGHARVQILDNFRVWVRDGMPVEEGVVKEEEQQQQQHERADYGHPLEGGLSALGRDTASVASFEDVRSVARENLKGGKSGSVPPVLIVDARSAGRWSGSDPEPRPGLPSGHIPGSISVPFTDVLDPETRTFLPVEQLRAVLTAKGVRPGSLVISSCGTGVTAAIVDTALELAGFSGRQRRIYDGSWTEWAIRVGESGEDRMIERAHGRGREL